jgi:hypothetical protein
MIFRLNLFVLLKNLKPYGHTYVVMFYDQDVQKNPFHFKSKASNKDQ